MRDELTTDDGRHAKRNFAKKLRQNMTSQEQILWNYIRKRQFYNLRFRSQVPIGPYIVDFACLQRKIVIEVDGKYHEWKKEYDQDRDNYLKSIGYIVFRCSNKDVEEDAINTLNAISKKLRLVEN